MEAEKKRPEPTQRFEVREVEGRFCSVSIENFPYLETDGYDNTIERCMYILPEKLESEIETLKESIANRPEELEEVQKLLDSMQEDLANVKTDFFKEQMVQSYNKQLAQYKSMQGQALVDERLLPHYEELLSKVKNE